MQDNRSSLAFHLGVSEELDLLYIGWFTHAVVRYTIDTPEKKLAPALFVNDFCSPKVTTPGEGLPYETDGDARRLA